MLADKWRESIHLPPLDCSTAESKYMFELFTIKKHCSCKAGVSITFPDLALSYVQLPRCWCWLPVQDYRTHSSFFSKHKVPAYAPLAEFATAQPSVYLQSVSGVGIMGKYLAFYMQLANILAQPWGNSDSFCLGASFFKKHFKNICESQQWVGNEIFSRAPSSARRALLRGHYQALWTEERSGGAGWLNLSGPTLCYKGAILLKELDRSCWRGFCC